jgi:hypothetical protein
MVTPQPNNTHSTSRRLAKIVLFGLVLATSLVVVGSPARAETPTPSPFRGQTDNRIYGGSRSVTETAKQTTSATATRKNTQARKTARARKAALSRRAALARRAAVARKAAALRLRQSMPRVATAQFNSQPLRTIPMVAASTTTETSSPTTAPIITQSSSPTPTPSTTFAVSIGFRAESHGFAFANWSASTTADDAGLSTARRLFGDASVCASVDAGSCTAFERVSPFLERLNAELDKGRCEGMVLLAFERFRSGSADSSSIAKDDVVHELNYWSATQILPEARDRARESRGWDLDHMVAEIRDDLQRGGGSVLGLYQGDKAHSVLPVSLAIVDGLAKVGLYDPNHPLVAQTMTIDLAARSWSYTSVNGDGSAAMSWSGSAVGGLSLVPFAARGSTEVDYFKS